MNFEANALFYIKFNNLSIITHIQPRIIQLSKETTVSNEINTLSFLTLLRWFISSWLLLFVCQAIKISTTTTKKKWKANMFYVFSTKFSTWCFKLQTTLFINMMFCTWAMLLLGLVYTAYSPNSTLQPSVYMDQFYGIGQAKLLISQNINLSCLHNGFFLAFPGIRVSTHTNISNRIKCF